MPSEASSFRQEKKREGESKGIAVWLATFILISMQGDALTVHHIVAQQEQECREGWAGWREVMPGGGNGGISIRIAKEESSN